MKFLILLGCVCYSLGFSVGENIKCPANGIKYIPLRDCTNFIICDNGKVSEVQCPQGLYYNDAIKNCDMPKNVPGCVDGWRVGGILTECGQSLFANYGVIEYKLNQTYEAGEVCTFILRHNLSSQAKFRFVLESHGIGGFDPYALTIIPFFLSRSESSNDSLTYSDSPINLGPPSLIPVANLNGFMAVVVFQPNSNSGTGFRLSFKVTDSVGNQPEVGGSDLVFNDESASPITDPLIGSCPLEYCADMLVLTSSNLLVVNPEYNFKLTMSSEAEPSESARDACYQIYEFQEADINELSGYCAYDANANTTDSARDYFTRGIFIITYTHGWRGQQNVTIGWEEASDPDN